MKRKTNKPEISYDRTAKAFMRNNPKASRVWTFITDDEAQEHWNAADADWTQGAYNEMMRRVMA